MEGAEYSHCSAKTGHGRGGCWRSPASERPKIVPSLRNQISDRAGRRLDRHGRIEAVLIEQVNIVGAKPVQEAFHPSRICSGRLPSQLQDKL